MHNRKRFFTFGIIIGICLVVGFTASQSLASGDGCAGDCMTCHPKLVDNKDHKALATCIECHDPAKQQINILSAHPQGCGGNCFECHDQWPKDGFHADLHNCKDCHLK